MDEHIITSIRRMAATSDHTDKLLLIDTDDCDIETHDFSWEQQLKPNDEVLIKYVGGVKQTKYTANGICEGSFPLSSLIYEDHLLEIKKLRENVGPQGLVELMGEIKMVNSSQSEHNNYYTYPVGGDKKEGGSQWTDYIIECDFKLNDDQNKLYRLNRLVYYQQDVEADIFHNLGDVLKAGGSIKLMIDTKYIGKRARNKTSFIGDGFMEGFEKSSDYDESYVKYVSNPKLVALREEMKRINSQLFTPESTSVNLAYVKVELVK